MKQIISIFFILIIYTSCTKDKAAQPYPEPVLKPEPKLTFMFVNRNGFRPDSSGNGVIDTVLKGVCLESKFFNPTTNISDINSTCYNRDFPTNSYPLSDSIIHRVFPSIKGSKFALEIEIGWKRSVYPWDVKNLKYATNNWPNGETLSFAKDTIIKFVWPDDTMPGSGFHKTFQYP